MLELKLVLMIDRKKFWAGRIDLKGNMLVSKFFSFEFATLRPNLHAIIFGSGNLSLMYQFCLSELLSTLMMRFILYKFLAFVHIVVS